MRVKKVNRYYCDYCKKANLSAPHMKKHEERCTMNPARTCGMCTLMDDRYDPPETRRKLEQLLVMLPNPQKYLSEFEYGINVDSSRLTKDTNALLPKLREAANNCPACIMAALRQRGIPVPVVTDFNFTAECKSIWSDFNESQRQDV